MCTPTRTPCTRSGSISKRCASASVVREADGALRVGADAFSALWARTPGLGWLARLLMRPRLRAWAQRGYDAFARRLYRWNRRNGRW